MVRFLIGGIGIFAGFFAITYMCFSNPSSTSFLLAAIAAIFILVIGIKYMLNVRR